MNNKQLANAIYKDCKEEIVNEIAKKLRVDLRKNNFKDLMLLHNSLKDEQVKRELAKRILGVKSE